VELRADCAAGARTLSAGLRGVFEIAAGVRRIRAHLARPNGREQEHRVRREHGRRVARGWRRKTRTEMPATLCASRPRAGPRPPQRETALARQGTDETTSQHDSSQPPRDLRAAIQRDAAVAALARGAGGSKERRADDERQDRERDGHRRDFSRAELDRPSNVFIGGAGSRHPRYTLSREPHFGSKVHIRRKISRGVNTQAATRSPHGQRSSPNPDPC